ncbi:uncharacterized protein QYS62_005967 [Fusarium acuminatum]|uniref:Uncharacterized protein n=1 Tax=Fusarium acuminatum TaxID=5515 RepID=A0ABZ2WYY6_9HYPO
MRRFGLVRVSWGRRMAVSNSDSIKPAISSIPTTPSTFRRSSMSQEDLTRTSRDKTYDASATDGGSYPVGNIYGGSSVQGAGHDAGHRDRGHWGWTGVEDGMGGGAICEVGGGHMGSSSAGGGDHGGSGGGGDHGGDSGGGSGGDSGGDSGGGGGGGGGGGDGGGGGGGGE